MEVSISETVSSPLLIDDIICSSQDFCGSTSQNTLNQQHKQRYRYQCFLWHFIFNAPHFCIHHLLYRTCLIHTLDFSTKSYFQHFLHFDRKIRVFKHFGFFYTRSEKYVDATQTDSRYCRYRGNRVNVNNVPSSQPT